MKKFGRKLAIVLVMMMIFTSFEFVGVFADEIEGEPVITEEQMGGDVVAPAENGVGTENTDNTNTTPAEATTLQEDEGDTTDDDTEEPQEDLYKVEDVKLLSGSLCVVLRWKKLKVEGVNDSDIKYEVFDKEGDLIASTDIEESIIPYKWSTPRAEDGKTKLDASDYLMCVIKQPVDEKTSLTPYQYSVRAIVGGEEGTLVTSNTRAPVRTINYKFTVKSGSKLKKHAGDGPSTYNLKKGQTLYCYGFGGGGCYMFKVKGSNGKESIFYCAKIRARKPTAIYTNWFNYSPEEAELYLNQRGVTSKTNVFLWCSQYTQHFYYMQGSKGNWECTDDWECSTGKPSAPTPTGMYGAKWITGKWKKHHNIKWWSKFSGTNSVHGQKKGWTFGKPKSNGCIRNPVAKAEKVYWGAKVNTNLLVF